MHVVERFTRAGKDTIECESRFADPRYLDCVMARR